MPEFVRADPASVAAVEEFLRTATGEPVDLGTVWLATGRIGHAVAALARARAITLGRLVCLADGLPRPDGTDEVQTALELHGALLVHECVHVWQYRRDSTAIFLRQYLKSYFSGIRALGSISKQARQAAYEAISYETEAFLLERLWCDRSRQGRNPPWERPMAGRSNPEHRSAAR